MGELDKVISNNAILTFFNNIERRDKYLYKYIGQKHELQFEETKLDFFKDLLTFASTSLKQNPKNLGRVDPDSLVYREALPIPRKLLCWKRILLRLLVAYIVSGYIIINFILKRFANKHRVATRKIVINVLFWPLSVLKALLQWLLKTPKF